MASTAHVGQPITWEEWLAMGETEDRYEVVEGRLQVSAAPSRRQQHAVGELFVILRRATGPHGMRVVLDTDWRLWEAPRLQVRRPDLIVVPSVDLESHQPVLAVEILSPGNRGTDLVDKVEEYARAGLRHYWVVDLDYGPTVLVYGREGDRLVERRRYRGDGQVEEAEPFPISFRPSELGG
ncbi:MAG: Uma2 family endonuclease [Acidimicrobiia bacterium]